MGAGTGAPHGARGVRWKRRRATVVNGTATGNEGLLKWEHFRVTRGSREFRRRPRDERYRFSCPNRVSYMLSYCVVPGIFLTHHLVSFECRSQRQV